MTPRTTNRVLLLAAAGLAFVVLATANGGGYRYGTSDQAFYIPVVERALDPGLYPRDGAILDAEGALMVGDEVQAAVVRATGLPLEVVFVAAYVLSLALIWTAVILIGGSLSSSVWMVTAFGAALTMRHQISRTSANSLEPYFHPRVLAFGLGALAVAALLRRRPWLAVALVACAALMHVTTALWFAVLLGVAIPVADPSWRRLAWAGVAAGVAVLVIMIVAGPLRGAMTTMDSTWLQAVASKDTLFPTEWPLWAWLANLGLIGVLWWAHRARAARNLSTAEDRGLLWGATALAVLFLAFLPFIGARVSLAVQFQISRVFWIVEFVTVMYVMAALVNRRGPQPAEQTATSRSAAVVAIVLLAAASARGVYVMLVEHPDRPLFETSLPHTPWEDAMAWIARQPRDTHILADPGHAWKYGTSVRVSARRDVLLEEVKDAALAIYSRDVAVRVVDRTAAVGDFGTLTADRALDLARRYDLDYLVSEADLSLPDVYRNDRFRIYSLR